jgi:hypothetical protein
MVGVRSVLAESWRIYRLLWRRSLVAAAVVSGATQGLLALEFRSAGGTAIILALAQLVVSVAGPVLVQAALVLAVGSLHGAERPPGMLASISIVARRLRSLVAVVIVYGLGVGVGLLLLVIPGLLAAARWCLMIPCVVLDGLNSEDARYRSRWLVEDETSRVLLVVVVLWLVTQLPLWLIGFSSVSNGGTLAFDMVWGTVTLPLYAHALTVVYYRLAEPDRPVLGTRATGWKSGWRGA